MGIHTGSTEKALGRDTALGAPVQFECHGIQSAGTTDILGASVVNADDGPTSYTAEGGDFTAQALHPRPVRFAWSATSGNVSSVSVTLHGTDFWGNAIHQTERLVAEGNVDLLKSFRHVKSATFEVLGESGATATVSLGFGDGIGTPVRIKKNVIVINDATDPDSSDEIISLKNPANDVELTAPTNVYPDPYNTLVFAALPSDLKFEIMSRAGLVE